MATAVKANPMRIAALLLMATCRERSAKGVGSRGLRVEAGPREPGLSASACLYDRDQLDPGACSSGGWR